MKFIKIFFWIGALAGFYIALEQPVSWWLTRNWVSTNAVVTASDMEYGSSSKGGSTRRVLLSYAYEFNGQHYSGHRATLSQASSNMGLEFKQSLLRAPGAAIFVHVNPGQPRQSVASRQIIWTQTFFGAGFALVWTGVGWLFMRSKAHAQRKMIGIDEEPGRVQSFGPAWGMELSGVLLVALLIAAVVSWRGFDQSSEPQTSARKKMERERATQANAQLLAAAPPITVNFELQDSNFAFIALGRGTLQSDGKMLRLANENLRIMQRADCPSEACRPIRSIQWLLVEPNKADQPDGAWRVVASSAVQVMQFRPQARHDQLVLSADQLELKLQHDFYLRQFNHKLAYLMVQLTAEGDMSTYSRTALLWGNAQTGSSQAAATNSSANKTAKSLYAALYYADAQATRDHLRAGASVAERYENDTSAAHIAAFSGCLGCLEALKEAGANLNDKPSSFRHETPLMMAIRTQQVQAARKLIELGADPCVTDREGYDAKGWVSFYKLDDKFPFIAACAAKR
jgi:hypothetical protein